MSWLSNLFKKNTVSNISTSINNVEKPAILKPFNTTNKIELVANGGELTPAIVIGELKRKYPGLTDEEYSEIVIILLRMQPTEDNNKVISKAI